MPPRGCHALGLAPRVSRLHHGRNATIALFFTAASCLATSLALADDGGAKSPWPSETISRRVKGILESPGFEHGHWGLLVVQASDGRPVFQRNADQLFAPASVTKLFSSAAALVELGADFRFETPSSAAATSMATGSSTAT
ncbi:MAG: D-alanyl-D-alanine carboxypeptidase [Isosphaeraceae bacterium]